MSRNRSEPPEECAQCGAPIPRGARACPECGADERTGWREQSIYDGLDLPDEAFDDEGKASGRRRRDQARSVGGLPWYWWAVAFAVLLLFGLAVLGLR